MLILISRIAQNVALNDRSTLLTSTLLSQGGICPWTTFPNPLDQTPSSIHQFALPRWRLPILGLLNVLRQGPQPNTHFWACHPYKWYHQFNHRSDHRWTIKLRTNLFLVFKTMVVSHYNKLVSSHAFCACDETFFFNNILFWVWWNNV